MSVAPVGGSSPIAPLPDGSAAAPAAHAAPSAPPSGVVRGSSPRNLLVGVTPPSDALPVPRGFRLSERVLADVLSEYGLTDRQALLDDAVKLDDGNRYLKRAELEAAAEAVVARGETHGVEVPRGYRWSERVVASVLADHGLGADDRAALLAEAAGRENGNRYLSRSELEAAAKVLAGTAPELGVVSDIDRTVLPPDHSGPDLPPPYPGIRALLTTLDRGPSGTGRPGDVHYVTARTAARLGDVPDWMDRSGLPEGTIDTGTANFRDAQAEKVRDITRVFEANPGRRFVLFGDTNHRDPEVYREVARLYPDRVAAIVLHKVTRTVRPDRAAGAHLVEDYVEAAAWLLKDGVLTADQARLVMESAQIDGLDVTDAEIDALIRDNTP